MHFMKFYQKTHEERSQLPVPPHSQVPLSAHPTLDKRTTRPPVHLCRASTSREELALFNTADCVLPAFRVAKHKLGVPCLLKNSRVGSRLRKGLLN